MAFSTNPPFPQAMDTTLPNLDTLEDAVFENARTTLVATRIRCIECGRSWDHEGERWKLKVLFEEPDTDPVPYCPSCHAREFE
jgi:hypothetical protein